MRTGAMDLRLTHPGDRRAHGRRFALPPPCLLVRISAPSRPCYQRVNWQRTHDNRPYHSPITEPPLSNLRGASVSVDARRAARVAGVVALAAMAVTAVVLFVAGAGKNHQIERLRDHGVAETVRVSGCRGLLGGSGSNPVGYSCTGTYRYAGRGYQEAIPGDSLRAPGSKVACIVDPADPALLDTRAHVAAEHSSATVFVAPAILAGLSVALAGLWIGRAQLARARTRVGRERAQRGGV